MGRFDCRHRSDEDPSSRKGSELAERDARREERGRGDDLFPVRCVTLEYTNATRLNTRERWCVTWDTSSARTERPRARGDIMRLDGCQPCHPRPGRHPSRRTPLLSPNHLPSTTPPGGVRCGRWRWHGRAAVRTRTRREEAGRTIGGGVVAERLDEFPIRILGRFAGHGGGLTTTALVRWRQR